jgi:hypothetical protein
MAKQSKRKHSAEQYLALVARHYRKSTTATLILPYHFEQAELVDGRTDRLSQRGTFDQIDAVTDWLTYSFIDGWQLN